MKEEIEKIIEELKSLKIKASEDAILECATRILISDRISEDRKKRLDKPTERQINFLKNKNYTIPEGMTFLEAKRVIGEIVEKEKNKKGEEVSH